MSRPFPDWPDQAERERRAAKARRATLCLALVASILLLISSFMSGCATKGDIKRIESWARHDAKMIALDSAATNERINLWSERWGGLDARVRLIEKSLGADVQMSAEDREFLDRGAREVERIRELNRLEKP